LCGARINKLRDCAERLIIGLLTAVDQGGDVLPAARCGHVLDRECFSLRGPEPPEGVPEAAIRLRQWNRLLEDVPPDDINRTVRSESRKERRRMRLCRTKVPDEYLNHHPELESAIDARLILEQLQRMVTPEEWALLLAVAASFSYEELAVAGSVTAGSIRIRVFRLRRALRPIAQESLDWLVVV